MTARPRSRKGLATLCWLGCLASLGLLVAVLWAAAGAWVLQALIVAFRGA